MTGPKVIQNDGNVDDPILKELADCLDPVADKVENSEDHALFVLGVRYMDEDSENGEGVQIFINCTGYFGIVAEGLYAELRDQIERGHGALFEVLREVIHDLEEDLGIDPDQSTISDEHDGTILH